MRPADYTEKLKKEIMTRLEGEDISRFDLVLAFLKRYLPWALALVVIVMGGIAFSVTIFVVANQDWHYRAIAPLVSEAFVWLPVMWIGVLVGGSALWLWLTQQTEFGYRRRVRVWSLYGGIAIVVLGALFYRLGVGVVLDRYLEDKLPFHRGIEARMTSAWLDPQNGRFVGIVGHVGTSAMLITDAKGVTWDIDTQALLGEGGLPVLGQEVRVVGFKGDGDVMYACRVLFVAKKSFPRQPLGEPRRPDGEGTTLVQDECHEILEEFKNERMFMPVRSK